ncbi:hypothetical protein F8144_28370 [Streptomyces triticiradicis]|uniref:Uncharacterized protein n=1 Tax=Streptomyces triticiradicis TaxID=2651189 RepID=A0A7J5D8Y7_9ACTN|nr:hypothetical protein F8144_28370 [Streptomyces triticiradicis]
MLDAFADRDGGRSPPGGVPAGVALADVPEARRPGTRLALFVALVLYRITDADVAARRAGRGERTGGMEGDLTRGPAFGVNKACCGALDQGAVDRGGGRPDGHGPESRRPARRDRRAAGRGDGGRMHCRGQAVRDAVAGRGRSAFTGRWGSPEEATESFRPTPNASSRQEVVSWTHL